MIDDHRQRILQAATLVYAQHGWKGATTRRIAEEAGVNEVTIFRHFGSKDALLDAAIVASVSEQDAILPAEPVAPETELFEWALAKHDDLSRKRVMVRQLLSDAIDRPEVVACAGHGPNSAAVQLREYVVQLHRNGWIAKSNGIQPGEVGAAVTMLMGAVFSDAMNRDLMPGMFPQPRDETLRAYVRIFLRGLGALPQPTTLKARTDRRSNSSPSTISK